MPDAPYGTTQRPCPTNDTSTDSKCCDTVCIDAERIYDSCGAKDCLSELPVIFTEENQALVNSSCSARICKATVITAQVDIDPVAFHRGFYAIDMTFFFDVALDLYNKSGVVPSTVNGLAIYSKRVVLYGSEGNAKTFTSIEPITCAEPDCPCTYQKSLPKATVQISDPMALSAQLNDRGKPCPPPCVNIPQCVHDYFGGDFVIPRPKWITATIGIFTITQLQRNVQMTVPSYSFCVPRKECPAKTDDPCEVFSKIEFPTNSFFPPEVKADDKCPPQKPCDCK